MDEPAPTVWELYRGQTALSGRLDRVVPAELFTAYQREVTHRFTELERDLTALSDALKERAREDKERTREAARESATNKRLVGAAVLAAVSQFLVQVLVASLGGGR